MTEVEAKEPRPSNLDLMSPSAHRERNPYAIAIALVAFFALIAFVCAEGLRFAIALKRIDAERAAHSEQQQVERLRIESARSTSEASTPSSPTSQGSGSAGLALLRETIVQGAPSNAGETGRAGTWPTAALRGVVDAFLSAGQLTVSEAKSLKDELQKAGIEIGVDAAKALIDRFIKVHDKKEANEPRTGSMLQGTTQINMYCGVRPSRIGLPPQPPSTPKRTCP